MAIALKLLTSDKSPQIKSLYFYVCAVSCATIFLTLTTFIIKLLFLLEVHFGRNKDIPLGGKGWPWFSDAEADIVQQDTLRLDPTARVLQSAQ